MNVILVGRFLSRPRSIDIARPKPLLVLSAAALLTVGVFFAGGYFVGGWLEGDAPMRAQLAQLKAELAQQEQQLVAARHDANKHMNALAVRLGEMQAHAERLNALGARLASMAEIDDGEFAFGQAPALGGPENSLDMDPLTLAEFERELATLGTRFGQQRTQLSVLEELLLDRDLDSRLMPNGRPVNSGWLSSRYGNRLDPFSGERAWHGGIDFAGKMGAPIHTVADGVVTWSGTRHGYGTMVEVDHGNGYVTRYAHNSENLVDVGERVRAGQTIALMGKSGRATAPNVHFEVLQDGRTVDPSGYLTAALK